jgi:PAS domain S-box-containing protein
MVVVSRVEGNERAQERSALLAGALEFIGPSELDAKTLPRALERAADRFEAMTTGPAQLDAVFASMADGVAIFDMSGNLVLLNDAQARMNGYPSAEAMKRDLAYFSRTYELSTEQGPIPVEDWPVSKVLRGETVSDWELRAKRLDTGLELHVSFSGAPVRDRAGKPVLGVVITRDITAKKRDQDAIRKSEDRYRTLFESIDEGFCILEMIFDAAGRPVDYRFLETNRNFELQTGLVDPLGRRARELVPDLDESWFRLYGEVALTGKSIRFENPAPAMGRWFNVFASRVGGPESRQVALVFNDITQRKLIEEALRESEAHSARQAAERSAILEQLAEGVIVTDSAGNIRFVNEAAKRIHGLAPLGVPPDQYSTAYHLFTEDGRPYPPEELPLARAVLPGPRRGQRTGGPGPGRGESRRRPDAPR